MSAEVPHADDLRLPRAARLIQSRDVRRVFDLGRSSAAGAVVVYAWRREDERGARGAVVVGRRWGRRANERNRLRRRLRESFRLLRPRLDAGCDYVLLPRGALDSVAFDQLQSWVERAARTAARRARKEGPRATDPARRRQRGR